MFRQEFSKQSKCVWFLVSFLSVFGQSKKKKTSSNQDLSEVCCAGTDFGLFFSLFVCRKLDKTTEHRLLSLIIWKNDMED